MKTKISILLLSTLFFTACSTKNVYVESDALIKQNANKHTKIVKETTKAELDLSQEIIQTPVAPQNESIDMNEAFMDFYKEWKSVKYKLGGNSKKGIDCSAFTQRVYKEKFDIKIPRTTRTQVNVGKKIKKSELELGDLVFFKTGKRDRHVGIYMGDGTFLHASIKGVKFTKLNKPFYKKAYWTSRRIIY